MEQHSVDIFPWSDSFNTDVEEIDQQHKQLVSLLNQVASYVALKQDHLDLDDLLNQLMDYALFHFASEESYWLDKLPHSEHTQEHRESHNHFVDQVVELKANVKQHPQEQWLDELLSFLASWLASHILESDKYMALLVSACQSGMSEQQASLYAKEQMCGVAKETITIILSAYKSLSANTIRLMREIRTSKQTLQRLTKSEENLRQAMDYAKIGRWSFSRTENVAHWSPQMYHLFGLELNATPGPETLCQLMTEDHQDRFLGSMERSFATGKEHHVEYQITRPNDGKQCWIECRGHVEFDDQGQPEKISGFIQDITERKAFEERIAKLAFYDALTALPNRRLLLDRLNHSIDSLARSERFDAILFLDVDNFKQLNDLYGHDYGDILLEKMAVRIKQAIRKEDTASRLGGDEFIIILEKLTNDATKAAQQVENIAKKLLQSLAQPYQLNEINYGITVSIGIVLFNDNQQSALELMKQADIAMYQAKRAGKNTLCFFDPEMQADIAHRAKLEEELRKAVISSQFELYYQPQINQDGKIEGAEALIRWHSPNRGLIFPDGFIALAEDTGLIVPIGDWIINSACEQLQLWQQQDATKELSISINVSYQQFIQPDFVANIQKVLTKYQVDPSKLKIELTESVLAEDLSLTVNIMQKLGAMGVKISLDDFGTGYSSLQYLKTLPIFQLKIDRSFVRDITTDANDRAIVNTIISMAEGLGLVVIAEGVETEEQKLYLQSNGCGLFQGYFFSKPMTIDDFESLLGLSS